MLQFAAILVAIVAVLLLVLPKAISRAFRRAGRALPCPYWAGWMMDIRPARWFRATIVRRIDPQPGETVLEVGPGVGTFTIPVAKLVGSTGKVIAADLQMRMIDELKPRAHRRGVTNIRYVVADAAVLPLEDSSCDRVYLIGVLGEILERERALAEFSRVLKSGGVLAVCEEFEDPDYLFPFEVRRDACAAGFTFVRRRGGWWLYTSIFRRDADITPAQ